jgi:hypothetical protein
MLVSARQHDALQCVEAVNGRADPPERTAAAGYGSAQDRTARRASRAFVE